MLNIISKLSVLHSFYSFLINLLPSFFIHNTSKYSAIKKILTNLWIDQIKGDYIEFGIFTASSFKHTINTENRIDKNNNTLFYGLDSFEGFPENSHPFFQDKNFKSNFKKVKKLEKRFSPNVYIFKGYFSDLLTKEKKLIEVENLKFVYIDCDLYISAIDPIDYIIPRLVKGSYIMIDDFTNIDSEGKSIRNLFYKKFEGHDFEITSYFGIGGVVIRYFGQNKN